MSGRTAFLVSHGRRMQVAVLVALTGMLGLGYSLLLPLFIAPDEPAHVDGVLQMVAEGGFLTGGEAAMSQQVVEAHRELGTVSPVRPGGQLRRFLTEDATPRPDRPSFDGLGATSDSTWPNYIANHPPTYYTAIGIGARSVMSLLPEGAWSFDRELLLMRWLNVVLLMATTWVAYRLARSVRLGHRAALVAMVLPLGIPQFVHVGSTVNNDNLYVLASVAFMAALVLIARPDPVRVDRRNLALLTGLTGSLVVLAKAQGLVALLVLGGVAIWLWFAERSDRNATLLRLLGPPALLIGPLLMLRLVRTGSLSPQEGGPAAVGDSTTDVVRWVLEYLDTGSQTFWGAFGWLDASIPWQASHTLSVLAGTAVAVSLVVAVRAGHRYLLLPWGFGLLAAGLPVAASLMTHIDSGAMRAMQGRYAYPLVPLAGCTVLLATRGLARRALPVAVALATGAGAAMLVAHGLGIDRIVQRHWGPHDGTIRQSLVALGAWAPTPRALTAAILASAAFACVVVALVPVAATVAHARSARRPDSPDPDATDPNATDPDTTGGAVLVPAIAPVDP